jgi:hypothetical protein
MLSPDERPAPPALTAILRRALVCLLLAAPLPAIAEPLAAPGDFLLRHDLELLNDTGVINMPLTAWPVSLGDVHNALGEMDSFGLSDAQAAALSRLKQRLGWELDLGTPDFTFGASAAAEPRVIRSFENTPREDSEVFAKAWWLGEWFTMNLQATYAFDPADGDEFRPDGTYAGVVLGNWVLTAGWQERWFGPGRNGSLILSNNARPTPGIALSRNISAPFETKWLSWMGPWTLTTFMTELDDERVVNNALLFGLRGSFRPLPGLEIGLSRTAQWCGDDRPCDFSTFIDLLVGKDNPGINVDLEDQPGNQLAGIDIRWALPGKIPAALYMQWIGEDGRSDGLVGDWLRQLGVETWGRIGSVSHRTYFEVADTQCRQGGFGFSDPDPNCAYGNTTYQTGYRYKSRVIGYGTDGDGLSYSLGSTLVQSGGQIWNITLRFMEINRAGRPDPVHTLSPVPLDQVDIQVSHERQTRFGRFYVGIGFREQDPSAGESLSDFTGFLRWSSR